MSSTMLDLREPVRFNLTQVIICEYVANIVWCVWAGGGRED